MVRTTRVTRRGTNAPVAFGNQVLVAERLVARVSPQLPAHLLVQILRERFGGPVGQRLELDGAVIVGHIPAAGQLRYGLVQLAPGGDREHPDPVAAHIPRGDEVGQRGIGPARRHSPLLAQAVNAPQFRFP